MKILLLSGFQPKEYHLSPGQQAEAKDRGGYPEKVTIPTVSKITGEHFDCVFYDTGKAIKGVRAYTPDPTNLQKT